MACFFLFWNAVLTTSYKWWHFSKKFDYFEKMRYLISIEYKTERKIFVFQW